MDIAILVRPVQQNDSSDWARMRQMLWPSAEGEHAREIELFFKGDRRDPAEAFIAIDESKGAIGFSEVSIRPYAEGCDSNRVAYLEGWFVEAHARHKGVGAALVNAMEDWARRQGCTELASDTEVDNLASATAHKAAGFDEVNRIICFRKNL